MTHSRSLALTPSQEAQYALSRPKHGFESRWDHQHLRTAKNLYTQVPKIPEQFLPFVNYSAYTTGTAAQASAAPFRGKTSCHSLPINAFRLCLLMASLLLLGESVWNHWSNADMLA